MNLFLAHPHGFPDGSDFGDIGLLLQTGAWGDNPTSKEVGVAWLRATLDGSLGSKNTLQDVFGPSVDGSIPHWSIAAGIDISQYIDLKLYRCQSHRHR
jgi:hypothetical protein